MPNKQPLTAGELRQFTGTETWYRHLVPGFTYTDGVKFMAERGGAYWLIDEIAFAQMGSKRLKSEPFQAWTLKKDAEGNGAALTATDGGKGRAPCVLFTKRIDYTDFPLDEITLWFTDSVLLLPGEY
jgi:hypothetical protein